MRFTSNTLINKHKTNQQKIRTKTTAPLRYSKLACALKLSLMATLTLPAVTHAIAAETNALTNTLANGSTKTATHDQQTRPFNISAGPLNAALITFAKQANIYISSDSALSANKQSHKLKGNYRIKQALTLMLTGTSLTFTKEANGSYRVVAAAPIGTLATAVVQSEDLKNGSAEDGYLVDEISAVGPWQGRTLQETPYSINVVSESLIKNLQATSPDQVYKINPVIQFSMPQSTNIYTAPLMRGFDALTAHNGISREKFNYALDFVMEETAQIEVLTGLSGFFYGADSIGGTVNYVSKRPTDKRISNITIGNTTGSNLYLHGDFGGQFDENGTFGYRLNAVTQDGDTHVENQSLKRNSISVVLDWQLTDNLLIEINASSRDYQLNGRQGDWMIGNIDSRPAAKDINSNKIWGQQWAVRDVNSHRFEANIDWAINDNISWRSAYETGKTEIKQHFARNTLQSVTSYNQLVEELTPFSIIGSGGFSYLDINFDTGDIEHTLTTGWRFSKSHWQESEEWLIGGINYLDLSTTSPTYFSKPDWGNANLGMQKDVYKLASHNYIIGDDIKFNEQWSALVGVSLVEVSIGNWWYDDDYKESAVTPNLSLIYQPLDNITTYASYSEGFEIGGIAKKSHLPQKEGEENVINAGEVMKPLTSSQMELGAKIEFNGMLLTTALFEIDKALEYYQAINDSQYKLVQDGRQVHRGLEFTATGKLSENITLVGGFTLLDAQSKGTKENPTLEGLRPRNVAEQMYSLYGEYNITGIPGLVINAGFSHTGSFYGDNMNTDKVAAYTLFDVGARYSLELANKEATLRLNINNLTDEQYWVNNASLGDRRTVSASVSVAF